MNNHDNVMKISLPKRPFQEINITNLQYQYN